MFKTNVFLVRHALTDTSVKDNFIRPLTSTGLKDTIKVTKALKDQKIARIYSSPYLRAIDTLKDLASTLNQEIITIDDFRERAIGEWVDDFWGFAKKQWEDFTYKIAGGESLSEVQNRNVLALSALVKKNKGNNIVIGTHGTALSTIINYYDTSFGYNDFYEIVDKMPYILCLHFTDEQMINRTEIQFT